MFSVLVIRLRSLRLLRVSGIVMRLRMFLLLITFLKASHSFRNRLLVICKNAYLFASMIMTSVSSPFSCCSGIVRLNLMNCSRCVYYGKHQSFQATAGFRDYAPNAYSSSNGWSVFYQSEERRVGKECRSRWARSAATNKAIASARTLAAKTAAREAPHVRRRDRALNR